MSARTPFMRWETGSIRRKVSAIMAAPAPDNRLSSNSIKGGFTRSWPRAARVAGRVSRKRASCSASRGNRSRRPAGSNALVASSFMRSPFLRRVWPNRRYGPVPNGFAGSGQTKTGGTSTSLESQGARLDHVRKLLNLLDERRRQRLVDLDERDRLAPRPGAPKMEGGDIDPGIAQGPAEPPDEAWLVVVAHIKHVGAKLGLDGNVEHLHDSRLLAAEERAGDEAVPILARDRNADKGLVTVGLLGLVFANLDAALAGNLRRIHHVHRFQGSAQQTLKDDRRERTRVEVGGLAGILDDDLGGCSIRELAEKAAELLCKRHIGLQHRRLLGADRGGVDRIDDSAGKKKIGDLFRHLQRHILLRLRGGSTEMGRRDEVLLAEERAILRRLDLEDVERRSCDLAGVERLSQSRLVDKAAARAIDDADAALHLRDGVAIDESASLVGKGHVERYEIGAAEELVELDPLHIERRCALGQ